jgi:signal transduction histidine kinase
MLVATTMPTGQADAQALRRRTARLAVYRAFLALTYLAAEAFTSRPEFTTPAAAIVLAFVAYSIVLLLYDSHTLAKTFTLPILFLDLLFLISLVFWAITPMSAALAGAFFAFLVLESWSLHGAREVILLACALALVVYGVRATAGRMPPLIVTVHSVLFLLVVGGSLAFLFSDQQYLVERRILAIANKISGAPEPDTIAAIRDGLRELAAWFRCSHAFLAFWDQRNDHYWLCRYPPPEEGNAAGAPVLEESREWAVFVGEQLTFLAESVAAPDRTEWRAEAARQEPPAAGHPGYDLHMHLVRKFQIYNAVGCGLYHEGKAIGRLLLINRISPMRSLLLRRLRRVAPAFTELVRHLLVINAVEHAAAERERHRIAQDFHDGPLQSVISFQMRVHTIRKLLERDPETAVRELEQLQQVAKRQVAEMRTFVNSMRPVEVDTTSLTAAARRLVDDFQKESGVPVTFISGSEPVRTPGKITVDVLQVIREALHNIHKHAQATHVLFSLEKSDTSLLIGVNDNGRGFRFGGKYSLDELETLRLGPNSIKQRMRTLGGDVVLESQPGHGTNLKLKIPLY